MECVLIAKRDGTDLFVINMTVSVFFECGNFDRSFFGKSAIQFGHLTANFGQSTTFGILSSGLQAVHGQKLG